MHLPPGFCPIDATIDEVASYRRESRWTTFAKIKNGAYESYMDGRIRKIVFASVIADRERTMAAGRDKKRDVTRAFAKRPRGRPRKPKAEQQAAGAVGE
jgi:hypothetical protein